MKINIFWSSDNIYSKLFTTENILGPVNLIYVTPRVTSSASSATSVEEALQFLIFESPKLQIAAVAGNEACLEIRDAGSPRKYTFIYLHFSVCHFSHRRHYLSRFSISILNASFLQTIFLAILRILISVQSNQTHDCLTGISILYCSNFALDQLFWLQTF